MLCLCGFKWMLIFTLILSSPLLWDVPIDIFLSGFPITVLYAILISFRARCRSGRLLASLCGDEKIKHSRSTAHAPPVSTTETESMNVTELCKCFPRGIKLHDSSQVRLISANTLCRLQLCTVSSNTAVNLSRH